MTQPRRLALIETNPVSRFAALERLAGWWHGRAAARRHFADEARAVGRDDEADAHDIKANEYEAEAHRRLAVAGLQ